MDALVSNDLDTIAPGAKKLLFRDPITSTPLAARAFLIYSSSIFHLPLAAPSIVVLDRYEWIAKWGS
jgi:hypothetical protein